MTKLEIEKVRTKARRANARLRALENAGLKDTSNAYNTAESWLERDVVNDDRTNIMRQGLENRPEFRTDISTLARLDEEAFMKLEARLTLFLESPTSTVRELHRREIALQEGFTRSEESLNKAFESFEKNKIETARKVAEESGQEFDEDAFQREKGITYEQYKQLFDSALYYFLLNYFPSEQAAEITQSVMKGELSRDLVVIYCKSLSPEEKANMYDLYEYSRTGTPEDEWEYL